MKTNMIDLKNQARQLVLISKEKSLIKSHTEAFKDFPVCEEVHKGKHIKNK